MKMHFQKQDRDGQHYTWNQVSDNRFLGTPSRRLFDRFNGEQVLFLINYYASQSDQFSVDDGKRIEQQINHSLPLEAKSEISVFNWIREATLS